MPHSAANSSHLADEAVITRVLDEAITRFSRFGFQDTKLEDLSKAVGMSKRMIHYHFGDKQGLYEQALKTAALRLNPSPEELQIDTSVPVDGVRKLINLIFERHHSHREEIRMLIRATSRPPHEVPLPRPLTDYSEISLHLNKLLILGQDAGAFRPGISSTDVFVLISGLTMYAGANKHMINNLFGVDIVDTDNVSGLQRMATDTVLAFLTANIPNSGHASYLITDQGEDDSDNPEMYSDAVYH